MSFVLAVNYSLLKADEEVEWLEASQLLGVVIRGLTVWGYRVNIVG